MKKCPSCQHVFDDTNDFCLNDGTPLTPLSEAFDIPTRVIPPFTPPVHQPQRASGWNMSMLLIPLIGLLLGVIVVLGYFAFSKGTSGTTEENKRAKDDVAAKKDEPTKPAEPPRSAATLYAPPEPVQNQTASDSAYPFVTVNSPNDGFLALKSEPYVAPRGRTLIKIPHGTSLRLGTCQDQIEIADRKRGRWCFVSYQGMTGWIFDAFVRR